MGKSKIYLALEKADIGLEQGDIRSVRPEVPSSPIQQESPKPIEQVPEFTPVREPLLQGHIPSVFGSEFVAAEQFRKLRTHLVKTSFPGRPKTVMITSAVEGEGKSFVSTNLAIGLAQDLHLHALLVDCDMRNPSLAQRFRMQNNYGLADYLMGKRDLPDLITRAGFEKLSLLPSGKIQGNPTELISSMRMASLVDELKTRYNDRYVIFDSTPLLATSESEVLAKLVDGIILVVRAGSTPRETVEQAVGLLGKEKMLGVVLNDVSFKSSGLFARYFGSGRYYYGYGYGKSSGRANNEKKGRFNFRGRKT